MDDNQITWRKYFYVNFDIVPWERNGWRIHSTYTNEVMWKTFYRTERLAERGAERAYKRLFDQCDRDLLGHEDG